jgi:hypothetical protein
VTGCLCDGDSRGKQPSAGCQRTGSQQGKCVWHFGAADPRAGRLGRTARTGEGEWHFGAAQCCAGCRRADGPIEPATHTSSQISVCLCAGIRSIFTNEARKHTSQDSRVYFLWSLTNSYGLCLGKAERKVQRRRSEAVGVNCSAMLGWGAKVR